MDCDDFRSLPPAKLTPYPLSPLPTNAGTTPGLRIWLVGFIWNNNQPATTGHAEFRQPGLWLNNASAVFSMTGVSTLSRIRLSFAEVGGNLNLEINGQFKNFENWEDLNYAVVGGCEVQLLSGGTGKAGGIVEFRGPIAPDPLHGHILLGGQEFEIRQLCWEVASQ